MAGFNTPGAIQLPTYKSPYGPKYHYRPNIAGVTFDQLFRFGLKTTYFGAVGLLGVIYFASGIPRLRKDVLEKIPYLGEHFVVKVPASDNPF